MVTREPAPEDATAPSETPGAPRYLSFYGLETPPFRASVAPAALWLAPAHEAVLATLTAAIRNSPGLFLLTGDIGTGKTSLANRLSEALARSGTRIGHVCRPGLDLADFGEAVLAAFDVPGDAHTREGFAVAIQDLLDRAAARQRKVLLVVDEAQGLSPRLLQEIRELTAPDVRGRSGLSVLLVGHTDLATRLSQGPDALAVRAACALPPLSPDEVASYIRHALTAAGCADEVFTAAATREIASLSRGAPGAINIIGDRALLMGETRGVRPIQRAIIQDCCRTPASLTLERTASRREHRAVPLWSGRWSAAVAHSPGRRRVVLVVVLLTGIVATGARLSAPSWLTWPRHDSLDEPATRSSTGSAGMNPSDGGPARQSLPARGDTTGRAVEPSAPAGPSSPAVPPPALRARRPAPSAPSPMAATPDPADAVASLPAKPVRSVDPGHDIPARSVPPETLSSNLAEAPATPRTANRRAEVQAEGPDPSAVIDWLVRESASPGRHGSR
jgi:general secretion pathway protein A